MSLLLCLTAVRKHLLLPHAYSYFPHCYFCFSYGAEKESLFDNQELLNVVIIFSILITFSFDSRVKCKEKIEASHS